MFITTNLLLTDLLFWKTNIDVFKQSTPKKQDLSQPGTSYIKGNGDSPVFSRKRKLQVLPSLNDSIQDSLSTGMNKNSTIKRA